MTSAGFTADEDRLEDGRDEGRGGGGGRGGRGRKGGASDAVLEEASSKDAAIEG